jgi:hypothetical protein
LQAEWRIRQLEQEVKLSNLKLRGLQDSLKQKKLQLAAQRRKLQTMTTC